MFITSYSSVFNGYSLNLFFPYPEPKNGHTGAQIVLYTFLALFGAAVFLVIIFLCAFKEKLKQCFGER